MEAQSPKGRWSVLFAKGQTREAVDAEIAEHKRVQGLTDADALVIFTTVYEETPRDFGGLTRSVLA